MKHRRPTQHIRKYRSGKWICVNRGIKYQEITEIDQMLADIRKQVLRKQQRDWARTHHARMTLEQKEKFLRKQRERRARMTPEQKEEYMRTERDWYAKLYPGLTPEEAKRKYQREWARKRYAEYKMLKEKYGEGKENEV